MDKIGSDTQAVMAAIPDFLDLSYDAAMSRFDEAVKAGRIKLCSISYSPVIHWSLGRHCRQHPIKTPDR